MKKLLILLAGLSFATALPAAARTPNCVMNRVRDSSGAILTLTNGFRFLVNPGRDRVTAGQWRPLETVQVCRGRGSQSVITNVSRARPTTITALRQSGRTF